MKFFIDTANLDEIRQAAAMGFPEKKALTGKS